MANSLKFSFHNQKRFIDQVLLFSLLPGSAIIFFLWFDFSNSIRTLITILFLSFYPGYLLVRRVAIEGDIFKLVLSVGLSLSLMTTLALTTLTLSFWNPVFQTAILVFIVMADALLGKSSLFRPSPAKVNIPLLEDPATKLAVNRPFDEIIISRKTRIEQRPLFASKSNYIWGVEVLTINNKYGYQAIKVLFISDLITQKCLNIIHLETHSPQFVISQLSWLFLTDEPPVYLEIHPISETDGYIYFDWLQKNYATVSLIPPDKNNRTKAVQTLCHDLKRLKPAANMTLKKQLEIWKNSYNARL
ncbi:MAG: hypothetical protein AB8G95_27115 [Anaerolineae bacterium]